MNEQKTQTGEETAEITTVANPRRVKWDALAR